MDGIIRLAENVLENTKDIEELKQDVDNIKKQEFFISDRESFEIVKRAAHFCLKKLKEEVKSRIQFY